MTNVMSITRPARPKHLKDQVVCKYARIAYIFVMVCFLSACSVKGPSYDQIRTTMPVVPAGHARLYIFNSGMASARIAIDGEKLGECTWGAFFWKDVTAGPHVVSADSWGNFGKWDEAIQVENAREYYLSIKPRRDSRIATALFGPLGQLTEAAVAKDGKSGDFEIEVVDADRGRHELSNLVFYRDHAD